jgi:ABC-type uncharacterized transport system permease subunit
VMLLSGAVAGLAGVCVVAGPAGRLYTLEQGYGYIGILVSWLAGHNPLLILVMALFYGVLLQGGATLQMAGVQPSLVLILQATMILFALASLTLVHYSGKAPRGNKARRIPSRLRSPKNVLSYLRFERANHFAPDLLVRYKRYWRRVVAGVRDT